MYFYQAIDLPGIGFVPGVWDHRGSKNVYLAHTDFSNASALDVGPANGFWSFEMERRGAKVTAVELGPGDKWDAVPHRGTADSSVEKTLHKSVDAVNRDFWTCHSALSSKVRLVRGSVYNVHTLIDETDIALMGNILQHLRDPFLAIERVAAVVRKRIIISESIWIDDPALLETARIQLIPRSSTPLVNHSWYQVSPVFVMEVLKILGFEKIRCEIHGQSFSGTDVDPHPRIVAHFTVSADR